ncbi:hypothetical protein AAFF_G00167120 [Aldrovandia affinis]|uniref:Uncharacterized protein n=1 Tax=Aldrovandia affinis TaxID=143900 RepID=A0AAD7RMF8_9TELE|nr:hypothetical protein AAFF_G00167120 [Aldrovandia affinis]
MFSRTQSEGKCPGVSIAGAVVSLSGLKLVSRPSRDSIQDNDNGNDDKGESVHPDAEETTADASNSVLGGRQTDTSAPPVSESPGAAIDRRLPGRWRLIDESNAERARAKVPVREGSFDPGGIVSARACCRRNRARR